MMTADSPKTERLNALSDAVFAVVITILALDLRPPHAPSLNALFELWPTVIGYAVSYLFIAIVWVNHHHLLHYASAATPRLIWGNFAHLFSVSLLPFGSRAQSWRRCISSLKSQDTGRILLQQIQRYRKQHDILHQERNVASHRRKAACSSVPTVRHKRNDRDCCDEGAGRP
jgi:hypothetical protein